MKSRPSGSSALIKEYDGFTITVLHDSSNCLQCMQLHAFYQKWKGKKLELRQGIEIIDNNAKTSLVNLISYLDKYLQIEFGPPNPVKNKIPNSRTTKKNTKVIQNAPSKKKNNQSNKSTKRILQNNRKSKKNTKSIPKQSSEKTTGKNFSEFRHRKKVAQSKSDPGQSKTLKNVAPSEKAHQSKKQNVKQLNETSPSEKSDNADKLPGKGTLKRKRWYLDKLKTNEGYEDDIFEERKFYNFQNILDDDEESDINDVGNMSTPKWSISLSPRERSESPNYEDCYNPAELSAIRKEAEEYQYRRHKRRKSMMLGVPKEDLSVSSKHKIKKESPDTSKVLDDVCKLLMTEPKDEKDSGSESDEDSYFTDSSGDSGKTEKIM